MIFALIVGAFRSVITAMRSTTATYAIRYKVLQYIASFRSITEQFAYNMSAYTNQQIANVLGIYNNTNWTPCSEGGNTIATTFEVSHTFTPTSYPCYVKLNSVACAGLAGVSLEVVKASSPPGSAGSGYTLVDSTVNAKGNPLALSVSGSTISQHVSNFEGVVNKAFKLTTGQKLYVCLVDDGTNYSAGQNMAYSIDYCWRV